MPSTSQDQYHYLERRWVIWYFDPAVSRQFGDCLKRVGSFNTIEDFWRFNAYLKPMNTMRPGCSIAMFADGITPAWEDLANKDGGRWDVNLGSGCVDMLDTYWVEIQMALVGENLFDREGNSMMGLINGMYFSRRNKLDRISVWTNTCSNHHGKLTYLGLLLKKVAGFPSDQKMFFRIHAASASGTFPYRYGFIEI